MASTAEREPAREIIMGFELRTKRLQHTGGIELAEQWHLPCFLASVRKYSEHTCVFLVDNNTPRKCVPTAGTVNRHVGNTLMLSSRSGHFVSLVRFAY